MNPGSGFGSGFGQQQSSSPFGTPPAFGSSTPNTAPGFGTTTGSTSFGSGSQVFGAGATTGSPGFGTSTNNTGFNPNTSSSTAGFGTAPGFGSTGTGTAGFGRASESVFGTSGSGTSGLRSSASTPGFSTSVSSSGPGFGAGTQSTGFGSSGSSVPAFGGAPSGFGAQTTTSTGSASTGTVFGSGFGKPSTVGSSVFSAATSVFGAVSKPSTSDRSVSDTGGGSAGFGGGGVTGFGTGSSGFGGGSSQLGTGSSGFGTTTQSSATGSSSSGFSTGSAAFGTGSSGFGTGSSGFITGSSGFGTGSSGFGTGSSGFGTGSSGFGTGSSGAGTGTPGFGTGSSGLATGSSGFGKGSSGSGFGTAAGGGFGGGSSVFGTSTGPASTSFQLPSTQTQSTSMFGSPSAFGAQTKASDGSGPMSTTSSSMSAPTGFSAFGNKASSVFGQMSGKAPGLGGGSSSIFSQSSAAPAAFTSSTTGSAFGGSATSSGGPGTTSGFGSVTSPSTVAMTTTSSSVSTSGSMFGSGQAPSVFGGARMGGVTSQAAFSTSESAHGPSGVSASSFAMPASTGVQSSVFGTGPTTFSNVFAGAAKSSQLPGSVFGGAGGTIVKQETSQTSASSDRKAMPFPVPPAGSGASVFGGASKPSSGQHLPAQTGSSKLFGGLQGDATKASTQPSSTAASVFGGRIASSVFGTRQSQGSAVDVKQTHSGGQTSETQQLSSSGQPLFTSAATASAGNQQIKQEPKERKTSGGFSGSKQRESEGGIKAEASGSGAPRPGRESQDSRLLKSGRILGRRAGLEAGGSGGSSVFEGKREATSSAAASSVFGGKKEASASAAASSVFGGKKEMSASSTASSGKREPVSTFSFPTAPGGSSSNQKRSASGEGEGVSEVKRGRSGKQQQHRAEPETQGPPSTSRTPEKLKLRRSSSVFEDISSKTAISCKGVSASLNKGSILRHHFSKFGKVKLVRPVPAKRSATIQFETPEAAAKAKKYGTRLPNQEKPLTIFWRASATEKSPSTTEEATRTERFSWQRSPKQGVSTSRGESGELKKFTLPSTVAAELASMGGVDADMSDVQYQVPDRSSSGDRAVRQGRNSRRLELSTRARSKTPPASAPGASTSSSSSVKPAKIDAASISSLRNTVSTTTMEKVNVLDMRDKLIRQKLGKQTLGGINSKAFVGTCPDMCPEKERLYREEVRRLSIYEIIPGSSTLTGSTSLVDHTRAVKEYSRSSADQDEPLPHELRPLPVLTMTMNYLLVEIANRWEEERWAEWYDFLWNRTRSIRKEITQQQLCSLEVVELLEKCVRFHIYCSERLCTEDSMVFDSKINDENLTKCLQTLKELYADMENKHKIFCPNEAEFRAYMVLMNLNEGDTLREVQQLRPDVRGSPEIGFAVKAYSALNSNNYVRFFRLVKSASFLNACILHRYFNQIRARALQIILRSHTAGQKKVGFSLAGLVRLLVFESEEDVREFCAYYGLLTEGSDLILDRSTYVEPESSIPMWRACGLVESKLMVSVGEVINGGRLERPKLPPPQCSFDEQGRFIGHLEGLTDDGGAQERIKPFPVKATTKPAVLQTSALEQVEAAAAAPDTTTPAAAQQDATASQQQQQASFSNEVVKMIARELFWEVINESVHTIAQSGVEACRKVMSCAADVSEEMITLVTADLSREVSVEVIDAERAHQDQAAAAERREREERVAADIMQSLVDSTVDEQLSHIVQKEVEEAKAKDEADRLERCTSSIHAELLEEVTAEMVLQVADQVHQVDVVDRLQLLADLQRAVELKRVSQWLNVWRHALLIRQRQKRAMLDFPCAPPMQSASQRLRDMFPDRPENLPPLVPGKPALLVNHRAQMSLLSPLEAEQRSLALTAHLSLASLLNSLQRIRAWQPLNLGSLLRVPLMQCIQHWPQHFIKEFAPLGVHWKLLLSLPGTMEIEDHDDDSDDDMCGGVKQGDLLPVLKQWLCAKFTRGEGGDSTANTPQRNILSQYSIELTAGAHSPSSKLRLGVIVRNTPEFSRHEKDKKPATEQVLTITKGTSAILFLLPHADTASDVKWLAVRLRLARLLEAKPMLPPTPLVLLLPCCARPSTPSSPSALTSDVTSRLDIERFQDQGLLSSVAVVELPIKARQLPDVAVASPILQAQLTEAVKFLASKVPEPPDLRRQPLVDVVEDTLTQHFFTPVLQDLKLRQQRGKLHQAPNAMIDLYNSVLDHTTLVLTSPALQDISWPAPELQHAAAKLDGIPMADWNSGTHLADIYELVTNLRLPWFHYKDQSAADWGQVCHDVWAFVNDVVKKRCDSAVSLTTRISRLLAQTCLQFENMCSLTQNVDHCTPTYINAPWTDIILACVDFRLQRLHNWKEEEDLVGGDMQVFYEEEDLEEFEPPASWVQALLDTEDLESHKLEDTVEQAAILHFANNTCVEADNFSANNVHHDSDEDPEDDESGSSDESSGPRRAEGSEANRTLLAAAQDYNELPDSIRSALDASQKLLLHVEEERQKAQAFEHFLEKALQEETSPDVNASHILPASFTPRFIHSPALALTTPSGIWSDPRHGAAAASVWQDFGRTPRRPSLRSELLPRKHLQEDFGATSSQREVEEVKGDMEAEGLSGERMLLSEHLDQLKEDLQAQRYASEVFEKRLKSFLES